MPARPSTPPSSRALRDYLATEAAGGLLLVVASVAAMAWANSPWQATYRTVWHTGVGIHVGRLGLALDLRHWVNDGLMAIFFLVVALEVKRELLLGELRDRRRAVLPVAAAVGGMITPALIYLCLNRSAPATDGWGIPMATDIAFAVGVLALVVPSIPSSVRLFLLTLAIVDDIGAIVVIAIFYSSSLKVAWLLVATSVVAAVVVFRRFGVDAGAAYVALGIGLWIAVYSAGVHPTIAGVVMGLLVPATPALAREVVRARRDEVLDVFSADAARATTRIARDAVSPLERLEHALHGWSSLAILPVFALANAGVELSGGSLRDAATSSVTVGVLVGLVAGKTIGIAGAAWLAVRLGIADRPDDASWRQLVGAASLAGIGFTVSLFISGLAFERSDLIDDAKVGILAASIVATLVATVLLRRPPAATA